MSKRIQLPKVPRATLFDTENGVIRPDVLDAIRKAEEEYARVKKELDEKKLEGKKDAKLPITIPFNCTRCNLHHSKGHHYVLPTGDPSTAKIVLVGEAPGAQESIEGKPFVGKSGQLLRRALSEAGVSESDICIINTVLCRPPGNRQPTTDEIGFCRPYFNWFMDQCKSVQVIVPLGSVALQATLGLQKIMEKRGMVFRRDNRVYIPTLHPAAILRNMNYYSSWVNDFKMISQFAAGAIEKGTYKLIDDLEMANKIFDRLEQTDLFALDIETSTDDPNDEISQFVRDEILGISFSWLEKTGVYLPLCDGADRVWSPDVEKHLINRLKKVCTRPGVKIVFANGKFDVKFLKRQFDLDLFSDFVSEKTKDGEEYPVFPYYFDVQYAHHLLWERPPHDLKSLARMFPDLAYYEAELDEYKAEHGIKNYRNIPMQIMYKYAAADADATLRLYHNFAPRLKETGLDELFFKLTMPLACVLAGAEYYGIQVNKEEITRLAPIMEQEMKQKEAYVYQLAGEEFNLRSPKQLKTILLEKLKIPLPVKKTGKKNKDGSDNISLDREVLESSDHPLPAAILNYRDTAKEYNTYIVNLGTRLDADSRLHASFNITGTETGRLSSSDPNLQNIPRGDKLRSLFIAKPGYSLVMADYSQIELRVMAFYSQDTELLRAFRNNEDIHTAVACKVFKVEKVTKEQRRVAKSINFGLIYGRGAPSLAKEIGCTVEEAQGFINQYFENLVGVKDYRDDLIKNARKDKKLQTIFHRTRHLPEIVSEDKEVRGHAERQALNMPIQSTAADCTNLATILTHFTLKQLGIDAQLVLSVHDELVFEVKNEDIPRAVKLIYDVMKTTAEEKLGLPVKVDIFVNNKWVEFDADKDPQGQDQYLRSIGTDSSILPDQT